MLSQIDGPRNDVEDQIQFTYYGDNQNSTGEPAGTLATVRSPSGELLTLSGYNAFGMATSIQRNDEQPHALKYDENQRLESITRRGNTIGYNYDAEGRVVGVTDTNGKYTRIDFDAVGRLTQVTDDSGRQFRMMYDSESRSVNQRFFSVGGQQIRSLALAYDGLGRIHSRTGTKMNYSADHEIESQTVFDRDAADNLVAESDQKSGKQVTYESNPFGMLLSATAPFVEESDQGRIDTVATCLLYTSPSPRDQRGSRMPSSA